MEPRALLPDARPARLGAAELRLSRRSTFRRDRCCRRSISATIWSSRNGPTAIRATAFRSAFPSFGGRILEQSAEARRRRRLPPSERECRPDQARHRPSRRHGRGRGTGRLILNGQRRCRASRLPPSQVPISANSPCKVVPPATPVGRRSSADQRVLPLSGLSRDACPADRATRCSTRSTTARATISGRYQVPPAMSS